MLPSDPSASRIPPLDCSDWYRPDQHLQWLTRRTVGEAVWPVAEAALTDLGTLVPQRIEPLARLADRNPPALRAYDARGQRIDEIEFHPAYKELESMVLRVFMVRLRDPFGRASIRSSMVRRLSGPRILRCDDNHSDDDSVM